MHPEKMPQRLKDRQAQNEASGTHVEMMLNSIEISETEELGTESEEFMPLSKVMRLCREVGVELEPADIMEAFISEDIPAQDFVDACL